MNLVLSRSAFSRIGNVSDAVGRVPTVRLGQISQQCRRIDCYLKLESCNPSGSIKDKNAVVMIEQAEAQGLLKPGGTIVESSSGNFGVALASQASLRGYRTLIVVDAKTTPTFRRMLLAYGAELVELGAEDIDEAGSMQKARMAKARQLAESIEGAWYPCQHCNPRNPDAHSLYTAIEIDQLFGQHLDALVVGVSTGGQLSGLARYLKPRYPHLNIIGVDVEGSVIFASDPAPYSMTGIGLSFTPPNLDYDAIHSAYVVPEALAYSCCRALARREGLLLGSSTGAIVAAGLHFAASLPDGAQILMLNPDRGDRYLETVYNDDWIAEKGFSLVPAEALDEAISQLIPRSHVSDR